MQVDAGVADPVGALVAALPVVAIFGIGLAIVDPSQALTVTIGALLIGVASRSQGGRTPPALLVGDAIGIGSAALLGAWSAETAWVHLVALALWSAAGGMTVAFGPQRAVVGVQGVVAFVVFGSAPAPIGSAWHLAAMTAGGALAEAWWVSVVRWPPALRRERQDLAIAYRRLAGLAAGPPSTSSAPVAEAFDLVDAAFRPTLFGRTDVRRLRGLLDEGRRLRIEVVTLRGRPGTAGLLAWAAAALERVAGLVEPSRRPRPPAEPAEPPAPAAIETDGGSSVLARRADALAGQLRAVRHLAEEVAAGGGGPRRLPGTGLAGGRPAEQLRARAAAWVHRLASDAGLLRANLHLGSPALRHAIRMAVVMAAADVIARWSPLARGYWIALTAAVVLKPDFATTFSRGIGRMLGTSAGALAAGLVVGGLRPPPPVLVLLFGLAVWGAYAMFQASYAVAIGGLSAAVLVLLSQPETGSVGVALDRVGDTLIGGGLALLAYAMWPTWSRRQLPAALAELVDAQRRYLQTLLAGIDGAGAPDERTVRSMARAARLAWSAAEATVGRAVDEPGGTVDAGWSRGVLAAARRVVQAAHGLRLELAGLPDGVGFPEAADLARAVDDAMAELARRLAHGPGAGGALSVDLRARHRELERLAAGRPGAHGLLVELDGLVDAIDTAAFVGSTRPS